MNLMKSCICLLTSFLFFVSQTLNAQSYPGGLDETDLVFWLKANMDVDTTTTTRAVTSWNDQSSTGGGNNATQGTTSLQPILQLSQINLLPAIAFDGTDDILEIPNSNEIHADGASTNIAARTIFLVLQTGDLSGNTGIQPVYTQGDASGLDGLGIYIDDVAGVGGDLYIGVFEDGVSYYNSTTSLSDNTTYLVTLLFDGSSTSVTGYLDNTSIGSTSNAALATLDFHTTTSTLGGVNGSGFISNGNTSTTNSYFNGLIGEIAYYNTALNSVEQVIVSNSLASKYGISIANDFFAETSTFSTDVGGIGNDGANEVLSVTSSIGALTIDASASFGGNQWVFTGHSNTDHSVVSSDLPGTIPFRYSRSWLVESSGSPTVDYTLSFDSDEAGFGSPDQNSTRTVSDYVLLYRATPGSGNFTDLSASAGLADPAFVSNQEVVFTVPNADLADGEYTLGIIDDLTFYSFTSGNWEDASNWTLDPSGTTFVNPTSDFPSDAVNSEAAVVLNGRTMTVTTNTLNLASVEVQSGGIIDLVATTGHAFGTTTGAGTIQLETDNFPTATTTGANGFSTTEGGTVEFDGSAGFSLASASTFNNVLISNTNTITLTSDYTVNGNLTIASGATFQINDTGTTPLNITINGNVSVAGAVTVGTGDATTALGNNVLTFHQFVLKGDLTVNVGGSLDFTNLGAADLTTYPTDGVIELVVNSSINDQAITCNGVSDFYRIEIDKAATSNTLTITANSSSNFNLFGRVAFSQDITAEGSINNPRALGLLSGTVRLGDNIVINELSEGSADGCAGTCIESYVIDNDAELYLTSDASVISERTRGLQIFGTLRIDEDATLSKGTGRFDLILDGDGTIAIQGGNGVSVNSIHHFDINSRGSYIHTAGTVTIEPALSDATITDVDATGLDDYALFCLPFSDMSISMSDDIPTNPTTININVDGGDVGTDICADATGIIIGGNTFTGSELLGRDGAGGNQSVAVHIGVDSENASITGGSINIVIFDNVDAIINSTLSFNNLSMQTSGAPDNVLTCGAGNAEFQLGALPAIPGISNAQTIQPINTSNNFTLLSSGLDGNDGTDYDPGGQDLQVGGNFTLEDNTRYDPDATTLFLNGEQDQLISVNNPNRANQGGGEGILDQGFVKVVMSGSGTKSLDGPDIGGTMAEFGIRESLIIGDGITFNDGGVTVFLSDSVTNDGNHTGSGFLEFEDSPGAGEGNNVGGGANDVFEILGDGTGVFGNVRLNDAGTATTQVFQDITITGTLDLNTGILDIGSNGVTFNSDSFNIIAPNGNNNGDYNAADYIRTAGTASDLGVLFYVDGTVADPAAFTIPIGTNVGGADRVTQVTIDLEDVIDDGFIQVNPVDGDLPTTAAAGGDILSYYWRLRNSGFTTLPDVTSLAFTADTSDDPTGGPLTAFVPGAVEDGVDSDDSPGTDTSFDRFRETNGIAGLVITFDGEFSTGTSSPFELRTANYTAGLTARFDGAPRIFYSVTDGLWNNGNTAIWTFNEIGTETLVAGGDLPITAADIVVIRNGDQIGLNGTTVAAAELRLDATNGASGIIYEDATGAGTAQDIAYLSTFGRVVAQGTSTFSPFIEFFVDSNWDNDAVNVSLTHVLPTSDYGDFVNFVDSEGDLADVFLTFDGGVPLTGYAYIPDNITTFPNMRFRFQDEDLDNVDVENPADPGAGPTGGAKLFLMPQSDITINGDLSLEDGALVRLSDQAGGDLTILGDIEFLEPSRLQFDNTGTVRSIDLEGNIVMSDGIGARSSTFEVVDPAGGTAITHTMTIAGDVTISDGQIDFNDAGGTNVALTFDGTSNGEYTNTGGIIATSIPEFFSIEVDKGADQSATMTMSADFDLETESLTMTNGTLILNDAAITVDVNSTGTADFAIPSTSGLRVDAGTVNISANGTGEGNGLELSGSLILNGADANVILSGGNTADNFIEFNTSGTAALTINQGELVVGSQLRQSITNTNGILNYTQTGGTAIFGANTGATFLDNRAVFSLPNASTFTFNNDTESPTLAFVDAQASPEDGTFLVSSNATLTMEDASDVVIDFGFNAMVNGTTYTTPDNTTFDINSPLSLSRVRVNDFSAGGGTENTLRTRVQGLTISGQLDVGADAEFQTNGFGLTMSGNLVNNSIFTVNNDQVLFNGATQTVSGTATSINFFDLSISPGTSFTILPTTTLDLDVDNNLSITAGTFDDAGQFVDVQGDLTLASSATLTGTTTGGIQMNSLSGSQSISSSAGTINVHRLIVNNGSGVDLNDDITVKNTLVLENGVFEIGDNLLSINSGAEIEDNAGNTTASGNFSSSQMISVNGSIPINGVLREFASGTENLYYPVGVGTDFTPVDINVTTTTASGSFSVRPINAIHPSVVSPFNAIGYYWIVSTASSSSPAGDLDNFSGDITFTYLQSDISGSESNYTNARLDVNNSPPTWQQILPTNNDINTTSNTFSWFAPGTSSVNALVTDNNFTGEYTIGEEGSIPDQLLVYQTVGAATFDNNTNWEVDSGSGFGVSGVPPTQGSLVQVSVGNTVTLGAAGSLNFFSTTVDGTLNVGSSAGNSFGTVTGSGTLAIEGNVPIGGNFDAFFSTTGGSLDVGGAGSYTIPSDFNMFNALTVSGGGTKTIPGTDYAIGSGGITITGGSTLNNDLNDKNITIADGGGITISDGTFNAGDGSATITVDGVVLNDTNGTYNSTGANLDIGSNLSLSGGTFNAGIGNINVAGDVTLNASATFNNDNGTLILDGTGAQQITGDFTTDKLYNFTVNKASDNATIANTSTVALSNNLTLTSGNVITDVDNSAILLVCNGAVITVDPNPTTNASFVDGALDIELPVSGEETFPVGKSGALNAFNILNTSAGISRWRVEYFRQAATSSTAVTVDDFAIDASTTNATFVNQNEYWEVELVSGSNSTAQVSLDVSGVGFSNDDISDGLFVMQYDDITTNNWLDLGIGTTSGSPDNGQVESANTSSFTVATPILFTSGDDDSSPLPVELVDFYGMSISTGIRLFWQTASELNNDYFDVERSADGMTFSTIGRVNGNGTTNELISYRFEDNRPIRGANYYRLNQVDFDGGNEYTRIVRVIASSVGSIEFYPNPATDEVTLILNSSVNKIDLRLVDLKGSILIQEDRQNSFGLNRIAIDVRQLDPGVYFLLISANDTIERRKIVIGR